MPATVTTLDREIELEERRVGLRTDQPLTDGGDRAPSVADRGRARRERVRRARCVVRRAGVRAARSDRARRCVFAAYAIEKDRHLRRLALLRGDSLRISFVVANELMFSGALAGDRELLDLRDSIGRLAGRLAAGLADVVRADCTRLRLLGPSGEVPVAAEREMADRWAVPGRRDRGARRAADAQVGARRDPRRPGRDRRRAAPGRRGARAPRSGGGRAAIASVRRTSRSPRATRGARSPRSAPTG